MNRLNLFCSCVLIWSNLESTVAFEEYQNVGLQIHNELRANHPGTPPMKLDSTLNKKAIECAQHYKGIETIDHSCPSKDGTACGQAGENLYSAYESNGFGDLKNVAENAAKGFYSEKQYYNYETGEGSGGVTGHFTQLVWVTSTDLGVGIVKSGDGNTVFAVFLYCQPGNVQGQYTEMVKSSQEAIGSSTRLTINAMLLLALALGLLSS